MSIQEQPDPNLQVSDYEPCGDCGFDHDYEYPQAYAWHTANPGSHSTDSVSVSSIR